MRCGTAALPDGTPFDGKISDVVGVGRALRALLARTEIVQTRGLVAAGDALATFKILRVPDSSTPMDVDAAIAKELPFDPERMATRWTHVTTSSGDRVIYAVAWDRALVKNVAEAVRQAGVEPVAVELKSASVARVVPAATCLLVDLSASPAEIVLIDDHLPQLWHSFVMEDALAESAPPALAAAVRSVMRYYRRRTDSELPKAAPVYISGEQVASHLLSYVGGRVGQPVLALPVPPRVPGDIRHSTYLACLGLLMRRSS